MLAIHQTLEYYLRIMKKKFKIKVTFLCLTLNKIKKLLKKFLKKWFSPSKTSKVLQLMDKDLSYEKALKKVLNEDKRLSKKKLEKELDTFI